MVEIEFIDEVLFAQFSLKYLTKRFLILLPNNVYDLFFSFVKT